MSHSAGPAPARAPGSARRTSSIDVSWPEGRAGNSSLVGRARDVVTPISGGAPVIFAEDAFEARLQPDRVIVSIAATPERPALSRLVGCRGGGGLRQALEAAVPEERRAAAPLYLILDDIAGTSLVAGWAWSQWDVEWLSSAGSGLKNFDLEKAFRSRVSATADAQSLQLLSVEAQPRVLPFVECPTATANVSRLLGTPLPELREKVLAELRGTLGCTHLNDALRALAEVPALAEHLRLYRLAQQRDLLLDFAMPCPTVGPRFPH